jgi:lysophospholipase L1-like esterase
LFKGLIIEDKKGRILPFISSNTRKIQFIGDSITCGYGNEGPGRDCKELRHYENSDLSYAAITAHAFNAEYHIIAISGKGIVRNYGDKTIISSEPMPAFYDRTLQSDPLTKWDHKSWIPDIVVIALGANDFSTEPSPDEKVWSEAYEKFVIKIRNLYSQAKIFCVVTRIKYTIISNYLNKLVEKFNRAGDKNIFLVQFPFAEGEDSGCDWHPVVQAHEIFAKTLINVISEKTGWRINNK